MEKFLIRAIFFMVIGLLTSTVNSSDYDLQELRDALRPTDLIVVGRLKNVSTSTTEWLRVYGEKRTGESGKADLIIEEVLWGKVQKGTVLKLKWQYFDDIDDLLSRNPHNEGQAGIYFLVCPNHLKTASSDYQCSIKPNEQASVAEHIYHPIEDHQKIVDFLSMYPLRIHTKPAYVLGRSVMMRLSITNPGKEKMLLPGIAYEDRGLIHGAGFEITIRFESENGTIISSKADSIKNVPSLQELVLQPGEKKLFVIDLNKLFIIDKPGYYYIEIKLEGFPSQLIDVFKIFVKRKG